MGRKSNDVESRKRKTKKDKARRKKELFGKYRLTRQGDTIASPKPKKNFSKSSQNKKNLSKGSKNKKNQKRIKTKKNESKKSKKNFSKSSQNKLKIAPRPFFIS